MPELPEVETIMRSIAPHIKGQSITKVTQNRADLRFALPNGLAKLSGVRLDGFSRRAKYMLVALSNSQTLLIHLGMSGRLVLVEKSADKARLKQLRLENAHNHVIFHLSGDFDLYYNDPRRFGFMDLINRDALGDNRFLKSLGPEPLSNQFSGAYLLDKVKGRKGAIKNFLLDQKIIAGLGNIYVLEALHKAHLHPLFITGGLNENQANHLAIAIRETIKRAIEAGGSTIKDFARGDGAAGYFQHEFLVYGREGEKCLQKKCPGEIVREMQQGRASFFCPFCQKNKSIEQIL